MAVDMKMSGNVVYTDYGRRCPVPFKNPETREVEEIFCGLPPGIEPYLWCAGSDYFRKGSFALAKQAEAIFTLGHYLFYGDPNRKLCALGFGYEDEREWVIENILTEDRKIDRAKSWSQRASRCVPLMLDSTETSRVKASLAALTSFYLTAPTPEDAFHVDRVIAQLRDELTIRTLGPLSE